MILKINQLSREKIETYLSIVDKNNKIFDVFYVNKIKLLEEEKARYQEKMIVNIIKK